MPRTEWTLRTVATTLGWVLLIGIAAGVGSAALTVGLHAVEHVAMGYRSGTFAEAVRAAEPWRRVLAPTIGGLLAGTGWFLLRRRTRVPEVPEMMDDPAKSRSIVPVATDAALQMLVVGSGASIGREGAPRQVSAVLAARLLGRRGATPDRRRVLVAAAAGAGLAAVYTTPIAGAIFALEVVLGAWGFGSAAVALAVSAIATLAAWPVTHDETTYAWPGGAITPATLVWVVLAIPVARIIGGFFSWIMSRARRRAATIEPTLPLLVAGAGLVVGLASLALPALPGNGKAIVEAVLTGQTPALALAALILAKPLVTACFLRAGATGGLLTPALATGAATGALAAVAANHLGVAAPVPTWALIGAASVLAVTQDAPLFAAVFAWELTRPEPLLMVPLLISAILAVRSPALVPLIRNRLAGRRAN